MNIIHSQVVVYGMLVEIVMNIIMDTGGSVGHAC